MERIWSQPPVEPGEHDVSTLVERARVDDDFGDAYIAVELILQGVGARVRSEVPYAETPKISFAIPDERSPAMEAFVNQRPA